MGFLELAKRIQCAQGYGREQSEGSEPSPAAVVASSRAPAPGEAGRADAGGGDWPSEAVPLLSAMAAAVAGELDQAQGRAGRERRLVTTIVDDSGRFADVDRGPGSKGVVATAAGSVAVRGATPIERPVTPSLPPDCLAPLICPVLGLCERAGAGRACRIGGLGAAATETEAA